MPCKTASQPPPGRGAHLPLASLPPPPTASSFWKSEAGQEPGSATWGAAGFPPTPISPLLTCTAATPQAPPGPHPPAWPCPPPSRTALMPTSAPAQASAVHTHAQRPTGQGPRASASGHLTRCPEAPQPRPRGGGRGTGTQVQDKVAGGPGLGRVCELGAGAWASSPELVQGQASRRDLEAQGRGGVRPVPGSWRAARSQRSHTAGGGGRHAPQWLLTGAAVSSGRPHPHLTPSPCNGPGSTHQSPGGQGLAHRFGVWGHNPARTLRWRRGEKPAEGCGIEPVASGQLRASLLETLRAEGAQKHHRKRGKRGCWCTDPSLPHAHSQAARHEAELIAQGRGEPSGRGPRTQASEQGAQHRLSHLQVTSGTVGGVGGVAAAPEAQQRAPEAPAPAQGMPVGSYTSSTWTGSPGLPLGLEQRGRGRKQGR